LKVASNDLYYKLLLIINKYKMIFRTKKRY